MSKLVLLTEGFAGRTYELNVEKTTVGRVEDNAFQIAEPSVSSHHAEIILKATKVDGVYDKDPKKYPDAKKFEELTFIEALKQRLNVMDSTAFSLCMDNNVPILVFDLGDEHAIRKAVLGDKIG